MSPSCKLNSMLNTLYALVHEWNFEDMNLVKHK